MNSPRRQVGFWPTVGRLRLRDLKSPEIVFGLLLGGGGALAAIRNSAVPARVLVAGDFLLLTPALVGVVFAALALVVALMSDTYLRVLRSVEGGLIEFLGPFMIVIGIQVGTLIGSVAYRT